jgi:hypothetical protein
MTIKELRKKSNAFISNIDSHIASVVEHNEKLLQLNKAQLKSSKNAKGGSLVNNMTGSANLSPGYAKRKNKSKPDIYDTGATFRDMDLLFHEPKDYVITSYTPYTPHLQDMYDDLFGIQDSNKAFGITTPLLSNLYQRLVLK